MPSHHRGSSMSGRSAYTDSVPLPQTSSSRHSSRPSVSFADDSRPASDVEEEHNDRLKRAYTELNKTRDDKDRLERNHEQLKEQMKGQLQTTAQENRRLKEKLLQSQEDHEALKKQLQQWIQSHQDLQTKYEELYAAYDTLASSSAPHSKASSGADHPKESRSSGKKENRDRDRDRDRDHDDRGRTRDREREKREAKELKAEKERLKGRFETTTEKARPPKTRRNSHIEGWGPSGRSASANPTSRNHTSNMTAGRKPAPTPIISQPGAPAYTSRDVPRTPNPLSPNVGGTTYSSGGSSATYDDDSYEDGNYHPYPIQRH